MTITVTGIADVNAILAKIAPREGINLIRATVHDIAIQAAKSASDKAPDDPATTKGDLKSSIKAKRGRGTRQRVNSNVVVAPSAYYWKFLEVGDGPDGVEHAFMLRTIQELRPNIDRVYCEAFVKKLEARLARERKRAG